MGVKSSGNRRGKPADSRRGQPGGNSGGRAFGGGGGRKFESGGKSGRPFAAPGGKSGRKRTGEIENARDARTRSKPTAELHEDEFVFGRHAVAEALRDGSAATVNKLFVQTGLNSDPIRDLETRARKKKVLVTQVPKAKLDLLTDGGNHQGVMLSLAPYAYKTIDELFAHAGAAGHEPFFLLLDNLEDPHNLGAIMRTADAVGVDGIIIPKHRAVGLTSTVAKLSTGAIEHLPVARVTNLAATITELKKRGLWIFGTAMSGQDFRQWDATGPIGLVIGNEGKGISPGVAKLMDGTLTIPMVGHVQSLNASVAAGILLYQAFSRRQVAP